MAIEKSLYIGLFILWIQSTNIYIKVIAESSSMWFTENNNRKRVLDMTCTIGNKIKGFIRSLGLEAEHDKNADYNCAKATHFFSERRKFI